VGAALAMAKSTSGVGSASGADKATVAVPKALESGAYGRAGRIGAERPLHGKAWRGVDAPSQKAEQALVGLERIELRKGNRRVGARREGLVRTKECNQVKGTHLWRPQRKGYVEIQEECEHARGTDELGPTDHQDREGVQPSKQHSPLEAAEGGYIST